MSNFSPAVSADQVSRSFKNVKALNAVSFSIQEGEICALLGANGAGKTTLMSILAGHDRPTAGTVAVSGRNPFESALAAANTSFIRDNQRYPDNYALHHALRAAGLFHPNWDAAFANELARIFRLPGKTQVHKFSRGQLSALAIVISLASRAPLTIFDEPYLGLDVAARHRFYELLIEDYSAHPRTVIVSTHLVGEMENIFSQAIILDQGEVALDATADELRETAFQISGPRDAVQNFIGERRVLHQRRLGALATATVRGDIESARADAALESALDISPVSLQDLVAAIGSETEDSEEKAA